jgi:hypothetical protein
VKLDPTIRLQIQGRGISITQNIYTGFDTEYKQLTETTNKLISVQLAVTSRILLKLPIYTEFTFSTFNTKTGEIFSEMPFHANTFNLQLYTGSISVLINEIRQTKFKNKDKSIKDLITVLEKYDIPSVIKSNYKIFCFPHSSIKTYIYYSKQNKDSDYSLEDLLKHSTQSSLPLLNTQTKTILKFLECIHNGEATDETETVLNIRLKQNVIETPNNSLEIIDVSNLKTTNQQIENLIEKDKNTDKKVTISSKLEPLKVDVCKLDELKQDSSKTNLKSITRTYNKTLSNEPISVSKYRFNYIIGHLTQADLSMLSDFKEFKENLDLVNNSLITLGKGFDYKGYKVIIRDTMLLSPASRKSLAALGELYNYPKLYLSKDEISNMDILLLTNKPKFDEYALRDAVITLLHALSMEHFALTINEHIIPLTVSSLGQKYVKHYWNKFSFYKGYQLNPLYNIGEVSESVTPKGLSSSSTIGLKIPFYIANYKGGRNESFMYGCDSNTLWYDYDLISAYTTALSLIGDPDYKNCKTITLEKLTSFSDEEIIKSFTIIQTSFKFPPSVKYPSIPCYIDESSTVYPLEGHCVLTGAEYILARNQGCVFNITEIFHIPFIPDQQPFFDIIKDIQEKRRENPKGSFLNLLYKEIGNSIYGSIVRGISNVKRYDAKTDSMKRTSATELSNPIIASWTTAFIRSVIGECLQNIDELSGKIVSVTTDGFITDIENLEERINHLGKQNLLKNPLLKMYSAIRETLSGESLSLEGKHQGRGMIS